MHSKCIEYDPEEPVYYGNRSICYLKKELFGLSLEDADTALKLNPSFVKAYFRRASANCALGKYKLVLADYNRVGKARSNDRDVQLRYNEVQKIVKRIAFERAIVSEAPKSISDSIDLNSYVVEDSYSGPRLDGEITVDFHDRFDGNI